MPDPSVNGILVQLPLPRHLDGDRALSLILPEKDVDGFHDINAGRLSRGLDCVVGLHAQGARCICSSARAFPSAARKPWS